MSSAASQVENYPLVERIADAVLYEGYILYPYRPSAVKNQQRWNFGALCPEPYAVAQQGTESSTMRTECLVEATSSTRLDVKVRFLHLLMRDVFELVPDCRSFLDACLHAHEGSDHFQTVSSLDVDGRTFKSWQEAVKREVIIPALTIGDLETPRCTRFHFPATRAVERLTSPSSGAIVGLIVRSHQALTGEIVISATRVRLEDESRLKESERHLTKLSVAIRNLTGSNDALYKNRGEALLRSFVSTHSILQVDDGAFVSLLDPPNEYFAVAAACNNKGTYPVLVGIEGDRNCVLSSPIILYDYPQIAPQSAGDLFDGTEIDEILTLRIMTLTEEEKQEMRSADELARRLLERTESLSACELMNLHGVMKRTAGE